MEAEANQDPKDVIENQTSEPSPVIMESAIDSLLSKVYMDKSFEPIKIPFPKSQYDERFITETKQSTKEVMLSSKEPRQEDTPGIVVANISKVNEWNMSFWKKEIESIIHQRKDTSKFGEVRKLNLPLFNKNKRQKTNHYIYPSLIKL
ncbi:hypothetical protein AKO1_014233 [Acrasis kona]|uniref:Uncharacterized protein n=1 Tax=Acrasis kona TaxID=1008807 RepID=A0AAW2Z146_9EUKA